MKKPRPITQLRAEKAYRDRQKGKKRLPGMYLTQEQAEAVELLALHYGTKTAGILTAITNEAKRLGEQPQGETA